MRAEDEKHGYAHDHPKTTAERLLIVMTEVDFPFPLLNNERLGLPSQSRCPGPFQVLYFHFITSFKVLIG